MFPPATPPRFDQLCRRAWLGAGLAAVATLAAPALAARRQPLRLRFSHVVAPDTPKGRMAQRFQDLVHQRAGERIRVQVHPDSSLYGDDDEMEALRLGAVEMLAPSLSKFGMAGVPEFDVFDLPYLFNDLVQVRRVTQGAVGRELLQRLARQQMLGLGYLDNGFKQMSALRPLLQPADFQHLRVRVQAPGVLQAQMQAWGARAVVLPFAETQRALAGGVVDAAENPLSNFLTQGLAPWQPHVSLTGHGYLGYAVVANPRFWSSLARADRTLLGEALAEALESGNRLSAELDSQALHHLRQMPGVQLHVVPEATREALRVAAQPVHAGLQRRLGTGLLDAVRRALKTA
ncbi:DctP family TRAP transporter solute-binding subunit [Hydrogenophaga palleronii]|uniref:DctP family TRAP transporter solute-binding subunit n=1 Tax=Hydrogenophaga palleronii TaxID=65655 RepID=UPI0008262785|nr:DctP family TRAP transporter solute-binding subunit [Hydrogenophaga palleronii]